MKKKIINHDNVIQIYNEPLSKAINSLFHFTLCLKIINIYHNKNKNGFILKLLDSNSSANTINAQLEYNLNYYIDNNLIKKNTYIIFNDYFIFKKNNKNIIRIFGLLYPQPRPQLYLKKGKINIKAPSLLHYI